jgi:hypothetical protein
LGSAQLQLAGILPKFWRWPKLFRWIPGRAPCNFTYQTFVSIHSNNCGRMPAAVHGISSYVKTFHYSRRSP